MCIRDRYDIPPEDAKGHSQPPPPPPEDDFGYGDNDEIYDIADPDDLPPPPPPPDDDKDEGEDIYDVMDSEEIEDIIQSLPPTPQNIGMRPNMHPPISQNNAPPTNISAPPFLRPPIQQNTSNVHQNKFMTTFNQPAPPPMPSRSLKPTLPPDELSLIHISEPTRPY